MTSQEIGLAMEKNDKKMLAISHHPEWQS